MQKQIKDEQHWQMYFKRKIYTGLLGMTEKLNLGSKTILLSTY